MDESAPHLTRPEPDIAALAERVAEALRQRVIKGALEPGERIVERRLCLELGVSRTPMREALKLLRQDGLVVIEKNRGARVSSFTSGEAADLFEVVAELESLAAGRFALVADQRAFERLEALHEAMLAEVEHRHLDRYFEINTRIHDLIVGGCGNPALIESHARLALRGRRGRYAAIMDDSRWREAVAEHEALMAALRARDPDAARAIWRTHLLNTGRAVAAALAGTGS